MPAHVLVSDLVSQAAAADYLGVSIRTVRRRIADGDLVAYRVGPALVRVRKADLDALLRPIPTTSARATA